MWGTGGNYSALLGPVFDGEIVCTSQFWMLLGTKCKLRRDYIREKQQDSEYLKVLSLKRMLMEDERLWVWKYC